MEKMYNNDYPVYGQEKQTAERVEGRFIINPLPGKEAGMLLNVFIQVINLLCLR